MAQISRHAKRQQKKQLKSEIFWGSAALITAVGIAAAACYFLLNRPEGLDPETLCPACGPKGHYVLLVDMTDPLSFTQKLAFEVVLRDIIEKQTPEGYLLSVFAMGEDFRENAEPLVEICNPGTGEDKSEWTANLKQLRRLYNERFRDVLFNQASLLTASPPAKASPIFEMLQMVGINAFRKHDVKGERRLIVVSDMLNHTPGFSMYKGLVDYRDFAATSYARKVQLDLSGVDVEIHYLINSPELQTRRNLKFWEDYFTGAGARIVVVRPLEG